MAARPLILIADEDVRNVEVLRERLSAQGYDTIVAHDGEEALNRAEEALPDLILLDRMIPKISVFEVCKKLKSREGTKDIPIIMPIARDEIPDMARSLESGADEYLVKPVHPIELLVRARTCLRSFEGMRALKDAREKLKNTQAQLVHSEKMASLGTLVAGIAHELNNPISFIYDNLDFLERYAHALLQITDFYDTVPLGEREGKRIEGLKEELNLEFIRKDLVRLLKSIREGAERTNRIVTGLRTFSRAHEAVYKEVDIHQSLENTLALLTNRLKDVVHVQKEYKDLPRIECLPGQLDQVFMNLLKNAADSIQGEGDIRIRTYYDRAEECIRIRIEDNGKGIPEEDIPKLFDPFFTTKEAGKGIGLGLSVSHEIVERHGGRIEVESRPGQGSAFTVILPAKTRNDTSKNSSRLRTGSVR